MTSAEWGALFDAVAPSSIFGVLFLVLLRYVISTNDAREKRMADRLDKQDELLKLRDLEFAKNTAVLGQLAETVNRLANLIDVGLQEMRKDVEEWHSRPASARR